jgi:hypothetical protein
MLNIDCSKELAEKLMELRRDGDYKAQSFARRIIRQAMSFRECGKAEGLKFIQWTYSWIR